MADEKRAGPWVEAEEGGWERRRPDGEAVAVVTTRGTGPCAWWALHGGYMDAPTPEAARAAADEALLAEGWELEEEPALRRDAARFTIHEVRDLRPEEREGWVSMSAMPPDPNARLDILRTTATPGGRWGPFPPPLEMPLTGGGSDPHPVAVAREAARHAGPWEVRGSTYVRMGPDSTALVWAWQGEGVWEWARLPAGERGAANTATRALWAADAVLEGEGWVLEAQGFLTPEERARLPGPAARDGGVDEVRTTVAEREPDWDAYRRFLDEHPEFGVDHHLLPAPPPPPAPVVSIIRRWAANRDAGRDVGEGAEVLLDELLEAVGTGRPPRAAPPVEHLPGQPPMSRPEEWAHLRPPPMAYDEIGEPILASATDVDHVWMGRTIRHPVRPESEAQVVRAVVFPWPVGDTGDYRQVVRLRVEGVHGGRWVNPDNYHLVVAPPVTEARAAVAWEQLVNGDWVRSSRMGWSAARVWYGDDDPYWSWFVVGRRSVAPTSEAARDAADAALRAAGWELQ